MKYTTLKGKFQYTPEVNAYDVTVRKPFNWLWLLLLLLLLPLFIRCERDVKVEVVDEQGNPIENVEVTLSATAHYLYKDGFFTSESVQAKGETDRRGVYTFHGLPCSVWGYIFHGGSKMTVAAIPPLPYEGDTKVETYHYTSKVKFVLPARPADIQVRVVDSISGDPIPGAEVVATVNGNGVGSFNTDAQGVAVIPGIHPNDVVSLAGRKEHYVTNDKAISRVKGADLDVTPMKEIPLEKIYECDDNVQYQSESKPLIVIPKIDMHQNSGTFVLEVKTLTQPDRFIVKDANDKQLLDTDFISTGNSSRNFNVNFSTRTISIEAYADPNGPETSVWEIHPHCPQ